MNSILVTKRIQAILAAVLMLLCLIMPFSAYAHFTAQATGAENTFEAATLEVALDNAVLEADITKFGSDAALFETQNTGDIAPQYALTAAASTCNVSFYNGVEVTVENGTTTYSGELSALLATSTHEGMWELEFSASSTLMAYEDEECEVELTLRAWQEEFDSFSTGGFSQEETISLTLTAAEFMGQTVVLNEVLPNPIGEDTQDGALGEWVELYNNTDQAIDLTNWYVEDDALARRTIGQLWNSATTTDNGQTTIDPYGYLVIFMHDDVLNNGGDTVSLYDASGTLRDRYSYGTVDDGLIAEDGTTQGVTNGTTTASSTSASGTEGKSDARIPDGIGAWIDPEPTAGEPNYVSEEDLRSLGYPEAQITFMLAQQEKARERHEQEKQKQEALERALEEQRTQATLEESVAAGIKSQTDEDAPEKQQFIDSEAKKEESVVEEGQVTGGEQTSGEDIDAGAGTEKDLTAEEKETGEDASRKDTTTTDDGEEVVADTGGENQTEDPAVDSETETADGDIAAEEERSEEGAGAQEQAQQEEGAEENGAAENSAVKETVEEKENSAAPAAQNTASITTTS